MQKDARFLCWMSYWIRLPPRRSGCATKMMDACEQVTAHRHSRREKVAMRRNLLDILDVCRDRHNE